MPRIVTIDPGVKGTGYAVWRGGLYWPRLEPPIASGVLSVDRDSSWSIRSAKMLREFYGLCKDYVPNRVICEYPEFFASGKGYASAAGGNLVKLAHLVGMFDGACVLSQCPFSMMPVREWKGQMSKQLVIQRIRKRLGKTYKSHAADAVGIGLHCKGHLTKGKNR